MDHGRIGSGARTLVHRPAPVSLPFSAEVQRQKVAEATSGSNTGEQAGCSEPGDDDSVSYAALLAPGR